MGVEPRAGLKEGKKRTNGLNAPTLIIFCAHRIPHLHVLSLTHVQR